MTVLIDIDDTLNDFLQTFTDVYNDKYKDNLKIEEIKGWNLQDYVNTTDNVYQLFKTPGLFTRPKPKVHAADFIKSLMKDFDVYLVTDSPKGTNHFEAETAPFSNPVDDKRHWVKEHLPFFPIERMIFCSEKWMVNGDILLDDKVETFKRFNEMGRDVLLFEASHNKNFNTNRRVKDLFEAEKEIRRILSEKKFRDTLSEKTSKIHKNT